MSKESKSAGSATTLGLLGVAIEIDRLLSAVACAGKAYHLTEDWMREKDHNGHTTVDRIQNVANSCAELIRLKDQELDRLRLIKNK